MVNLVSSINILGVMGSSIKLQFLWVCRSPAQNIYYRLLYIASYIIYSDYSYSCLMLFNHVLPSPNTQYPTMIVYNIFISLDGLHLLGLTLVKFLDFMRFLNVNPMLETLRLGIAQMSSKKRYSFIGPTAWMIFLHEFTNRKLVLFRKWDTRIRGNS